MVEATEEPVFPRYNHMPHHGRLAALTECLALAMNHYAVAQIEEKALWFWQRRSGTRVAMDIASKIRKRIEVEATPPPGGDGVEPGTGKGEG